MLCRCRVFSALLYLLTVVFSAVTPTLCVAAAGNRQQEYWKDPAGTLERQITRTYDALNRLQKVGEGAL